MEAAPRPLGRIVAKTLSEPPERRAEGVADKGFQIDVCLTGIRCLPLRRQTRILPFGEANSTWRSARSSSGRQAFDTAGQQGDRLFGKAFGRDSFAPIDKEDIEHGWGNQVWIAVAVPRFERGDDAPYFLLGIALQKSHTGLRCLDCT